MNLAQRYQEAQQFFHKGQLREAVNICRELIDTQPQFADAYDLMGLLLRHTGNFERAMAFSEYAIRFAPKHAPFYVHKALHAMGCAKFQDAIAALSKAVSIDPALFLAHLLLGDCYAHIQHEVYARAHFAKARALNDNADVDEHEGLALLMLGHAEEALKKFESLINRRPDYFGGYMHAAKLALQRRDILQAGTFARRAVTLNPQAYEAWTVLGTLAYEQQNYAEAAEQLERAITCNPNFVPSYLNYASVVFRKGDFVKTEEILQRALVVAPEHIGVLEQLSNVMARNGKTPEAIALLQRILEKQPDNVSVRHLCNALQGVSTPVAPQAYVAQVFDGCAEQFEDHLQNKLAYHIPELLAQKFHSLYEASDLSLLDIGCGTGLVAEAFAAFTSHRVGIDLSSGMIAKARMKKLYDALHVAEAVECVRGLSEQFDVAVAADVLVYIGDLKALFDAVHARLKTGHIFAFSVESDDAAASYVLRPTGRYAHSASYIKSLAQECGFSVELLEPAVIRKEGNQDVGGYIVFLGKH